MKLSSVMRSVLKTAVYIMDQTAQQVDRASSRAAEIAEDARESVYPGEDHTLRNVVAFDAGIGVGVGVGLLLAPSSGSELRNSIGNKVQEITNRAKGETYATGTGPQ